MGGYITRRIISLCFVMLTVSAIVFFLMNAVPGGPFSISERGISPDTADLLRARGHQVEYGGPVARVEAIRVVDGRLEGGSDGRGYDGKAGGF